MTATAARSRRSSPALHQGGSLELMGRAEAAKALGVNPQNLNAVVGLPAPVITYLKRGDLWLASEIREFAIQRKQRA